MAEETENKLEGRTQKKVTIWWIYLLIGLVALVVFASMGYIFYLGNHMTKVHTPLIDAAMEIKIEATTGHLWFEEIISGDRFQSIDDVLEHINQADWYAQAMLEGGQSAEGKYFPLSDPQMRQDIKEVRRKLTEFRNITLQRWQTSKTAGIGTEIEQKYDAVFKDFIQQADLVETDLQQIIAKQLKNFQIVQIVLIVICMAVTVVVGITFSRFLKNQIRHKLELHSANQQLDASNQQLLASEQQLMAANQQLTASEQQLMAANQQLTASEQQLMAANQQLMASEQQLKAANQQLMASEKEAWILAKFPSENPNPVLRISKDNAILYSNQAAEPILTAWGCEENRCLCLPDRENKLMAVALSSSKPVAIDLDHSNRTFSMTLAPIPESGYVNIYAHDITKRKKAEEKLLGHQEKLKSLASQLSIIEERERHRLATDLHDHIGQSLVMSKMKLDSLRESISSGESADVLGEVCDCIGDVIRETRTLTFDLSSPILYELGFETAVSEWLDEQIREKHGIPTEFRDDGQSKPLDNDIRALLFRNVRELLINVIKHAKARKVKVSVSKVNEQICVIIEDDGVGFEPANIGSNTGFGIFSIRERLEQLGGHLEIESEPGRGSRFTMTAPLKA